MLVLHRRRSRGVTPLVGMILLLGIVAVAAIGLFVVGTALTGATQDAAEDKQTVDSFQEFSADIDRLVDEDTDSGTFLIDGRKGAVTAVEPSAGHVEVYLERNGTVSTLYNDSLGAVRYEAADTELAYQAGGIWRGGAENRSAMVRPPRFDYQSSPAPTLTLPVISVRGSATDTGDFDGRVTVENRSDVYPAGPNRTNPLEADRVVVDVQSSYCTAWSSYVDDRTDGHVVEQCGETINTTDAELRVELPVADRASRNATGTAPVNTTVNVVPPSSTPGNATNVSSVNVTGPVVTNGTSTPADPPANVTTAVSTGDSSSDDGRVYGLYVEEDVSLTSIGGQIQGSLGSGGTFTGSATGLNQNGSIDDDVAPNRDPHDDEIEAIARGAGPSDEVTDFCGSPWGECEFSGPRTIVVDASEFNDGGRHVEFDVSSGNITLLVVGDFETRPPTTWEVTGYESGNSLNVYTTGDLSIGGSVYTTPDTSLNPFQPVTRWDEIKDEEYHPEALTFHAPSDSEVSVANGVRIEGSISAPGATATGDSMSHQQVGAIYVGEWDVDSASLNLYPAPGSEGRPVEGSGPSGPGTFEVSITANATGDPIEDAVVGVSNDSGLVDRVATDSTGRVSVTVASGNYSLAVDASGYRGTTLSDVPVNSNATTVVDVSLPTSSPELDDGQLRGTVVNGSASGTEPVEDAHVEVRNATNGSTVERVETAGDGTYDVTLQPGTYNVTVTHADYQEIDPTTVSISANATTWTNASLAPTVSAPTTGSMAVAVHNGTLVGPNGTRPMDGTPIVGATVRVTHPNGTTVATSTTASNGTAIVTGLDATTGYEIEVNATDFDENDHAGITVEPGGRTAVEVPMKPSHIAGTGTGNSSVSGSELYYLHVSEIELSIEDS